MINIRSNVFETNSSSTHSVSLKFSGIHEGMLLERVKLNSKGQIVLTGGDFASTEIELHSAIQKLNFIGAYILVYGDEALKNRFEKVVKEQTGASEIVYNMRFVANDGKPANTFFSPEYSDPYGQFEDDDENEGDNCDEIQLHDILDNEGKLRAFLFSKDSSISSSIRCDG